MNRIFVDSNIWVYLFVNGDSGKCKIAEQYIFENCNKSTLIISFQVINEVTNVLSRKKFTEPDIRNIIEQLTKICVIQDYSKEIALAASELREEHSFSFWDSHIVASAAASHCSMLASEDMQDGQVVKGVTIKNIFSQQYSKHHFNP